MWEFSTPLSDSQECGNISTPTNTEVVFSEVELNGSYWPVYCWNNYSFPYGTYAGFLIEWGGPPNGTANNTWYQWLDYDGTWELVDAFGPTPQMTPYSEYFEIVNESQTYSSSASPPSIPPTGDGSNQLERYEQWLLWNQQDTIEFAREGPCCWTPST